MPLAYEILPAAFAARIDDAMSHTASERSPCALRPLKIASARSAGFGNCVVIVENQVVASAAYCGSPLAALSAVRNSRSWLYGRSNGCALWIAVRNWPAA